MNTQEFNIGRSETNQIIINDQQVSKQHAKLIISPTNQATIVDLSSTNGTFVNGKQVTEQLLKMGDKVTLGNIPLNWETYVFDKTGIVTPSNNKKKNNKIVWLILVGAMVASIIFKTIEHFVINPKKAPSEIEAPKPWDLKNDSITYSISCLRDSNMGGQIIEFMSDAKNRLFNLEGVEVTLEEEQQVGEEIKAQIDANEKYSESPEYKGRIDGIMYKLLAQMPQRRFNYKWFVIESEQLNAFTAGGYIFVYTGMIDFAQNDDELACILGHEIYHNELGHIQNKLKEIKFMQNRLGILANVAMMANSMLTQSFNQENEAYCDMYGLDLAVKAGYNGCAGIDLWKRMSENDEEKTLAGQLLRSHPYGIERANCTHKHIERNYHASCTP
jgi:hypothetical protein